MNVVNGGQKRLLQKPIPERIREAREARGFTPEEFAELLNITRQALAQYETGQTVPSGDVMSKIIALTAQPPAFFVTVRERPESAGSPFWRGLKRMEIHHRRRIARRLQWARDITTFVERFVELPEVRLPSIEFNPQIEDEEQIELAAEQLRDFWGLGRGPIKDLSSMLEANGILIVREPVDCPDMDAVSIWQGGRPFILLSSQTSSPIYS
jgi:transcriptional regulator with XRE-family HTH domain